MKGIQTQQKCALRRSTAHSYQTRHTFRTRYANFFTALAEDDWWNVSRNWFSKADSSRQPVLENISKIGCGKANEHWGF